MNKEALYLDIINHLNDGVYFVDLERRITFWNKAAETISGYTADEILGHQCGENLLNHINSEGKPLCIVGCPLFDAINNGGHHTAEVFLRHKDGHRVPIMVNIFPMEEDGEVVGAIEIFTPNSPITYKDDLIEQLSNMAMRDGLTGLPNRRYLQSFIEYKISEYKRFNSPFAVLFLDIDNFRVFNNTYGHDAGDAVLKGISETVRKSTRKSDMFGRWGGEEFVGIYSTKSPEDIPHLAEKIRVLIENTQIEHDTPLSVTASIGITAIRPDEDLEAIVERADHLMYKSKAAGKNRVTSD